MDLAPPGRTSIDTLDSGTSPPGWPNQSAKLSGSVHSFQTRSRGASKTRLMVNAYRSVIRGSLAAREPLVQAIEAVLPEAPVAEQPLHGLREGVADQP